MCSSESYISWYQILSETFISEFSNRVDWKNISIYQILSEKFIKGRQDKVDLYFIGKYQKLSEDFITEFGDKINWAFISKYQDLSQKFIFENNLLTYDLSYQNLSDEFRERYNLNTSILFSVFNCGRLNRVIYILKEDPNRIHIGTNGKANL